MASRKKFSRVLAWILAVATIAGNVPTTIFASNDYDIVVDDDSGDYSVTVNDGSGEKEVPQASGSTTSASETDTQPDKKKSDTQKKTQTAEGMDFSSKRLLVGTDKKSSLPDNAEVLNSYNGVYLLQFASESDAKDTFTALQKDKSVDFCAPDTPVSAADGDAKVSEGITDMTKKDNPISELKSELKDNDEKPHVEKENVIALLDTGASESENVIESVSMIGDDTKDDNGHGEKMVNAILSQNPDAKIISIKVLDKNGEGNASSIYAGLQYAMEKGATIANLSLSGYAKSENEALKSIIEDAVTSGVDVIGAAGNNGMNAKYFVPGSVDAATIIGSSDENGNRRSDSNYGKTVDYLVHADTSSEAAAIFSGFTSKYLSYNDIDYTKNQKNLIFVNPDILDGIRSMID